MQALLIERRKFMKNKRFFTTLLSLTIALSNFATPIVAEEAQPVYEITDEYVFIDSVAYEIVDNTIEYDNMTYELQGYTLVAYEDDGSQIRLVLPVEQNEVTDPVKLAKINVMFEESNLPGRKIPSNPVDLPYSETVPEGEWYTETPFFNMIVGKFYNFTYLTFKGLPSSEKKFSIGFMYLDMYGKVYEDSDKFFPEYNLGSLNYLKIKNLSTMRYGVFQMGNLYGESSYTYTISLKNL